MIFNVVCRALLALTVTTVFTTATVSSVFASQAGPHKSSRGSALDSEASVPEEMVSSLIVKPHAVAGAQVSNALRAFDGRDLSRSALVPLTVLRPMSGKAPRDQAETASHLVRGASHRSTVNAQPPWPRIC